MGPRNRDRKQNAVLWAATAGEIDTSGELKRAAPVSIKVRWEFERTDGIDPQGMQISYDATVVVGLDVEVGSVLYLGTLSSYNSASPAPTVYAVRNFSKIPDVKGLRFRRVVLLQKYSTELPALIT